MINMHTFFASPIFLFSRELGALVSSGLKILGPHTSCDRNLQSWCLVLQGNRSDMDLVKVGKKEINTFWNLIAYS